MVKHVVRGLAISALFAGASYAFKHSKGHATFMFAFSLFNYFRIFAQ